MQMNIATGPELVGTIGANAEEGSVAYANIAYAEKVHCDFHRICDDGFHACFVASLENACAKVCKSRRPSPTTGG